MRDLITINPQFFIFSDTHYNDQTTIYMILNIKRLTCFLIFPLISIWKGLDNFTNFRIYNLPTD